MAEDTGKLIYVYFDKQRAEDYLILLNSAIEIFSYIELNNSTLLLLKQFYTEFPEFKKDYENIYKHYIENKYESN